MINTDLVKDNVAVKIKSEQEYREFAEAMHWPYSWALAPSNTYVWPDKSDKDLHNYSFSPPVGYKKIEFSELIQSRISIVLGIKDEEKFKFRDWNDIYWVEDGRICSKHDNVTTEDIFEIVNNPEKITLIPIYIQDTIEDADAALHMGFETVKKRSKDGIVLTTKLGQNYYTNKEIFVDIPVDVRLNLVDIAGG